MTLWRADMKISMKNKTSIWFSFFSSLEFNRLKYRTLTILNLFWIQKIQIVKSAGLSLFIAKVWMCFVWISVRFFSLSLSLSLYWFHFLRFKKFCWWLFFSFALSSSSEFLLLSIAQLCFLVSFSLKWDMFPFPFTQLVCYA